jgi:hypothetical protein
MSTGPVPADFKGPRRLQLAEEPHRTVIYGEEDAGKTTMAATWPRPCIIDTDHNLIALAVAGLEPLTYAPTGYDDIQRMFAWMKERRDQFDTIIWDSVSTGQSLLLNEVHDQGLVGKSDVKPMMRFVPEQGEHLAQQKQLERILNNLGQFRKHIVLTAGVQEVGAIRRPQMSPGNYNIIRYWPSLMGELVLVTHHPQTGEEFPEPKRFFATQPGVRATKAKFRSLRPGIWDPTYDKIQAKINAEYAQAKAAKAASAKESA